MKKYVLAIDQGTTGSTALLMDAKTYEFVDKVNYEFPQIYPKPGWVEHDLNQIWDSVENSIKDVLSNNDISSNQIQSIGITNQRETTCAFDDKGEPLCNAIVWQDRRTSDYCQSKSESYSHLKNMTGLPLDPYFSATKMKWLQDNVDKVKKAKESGKLHFSTIDAFLLYKISGCKSFSTEPSNASRTLLMNIETTEWDTNLLDFFEIDKKSLPTIQESFSTFGVTQGLSFLPDGIPISCILGDQQAALFGQAGFKKGDLKCTYGTGAFILLNTGEERKFSQNGLLTTVAFKHQGRTSYALEGSCYIAGAAVQWLRDNIGIIKDSPAIENLAKEVTNLEQMEHLIFLPFFTGIGSPYWNPDVKAAIMGITRDTSNAHIARACLDGMALSINDSIKALAIDSSSDVKSIRVDGGASQNDLLMQIQANFSKKEIIRPKVIETTAYGVAIGSLIGINLIDFEQIEKLWKKDRSFNYEESSYYPQKSLQWDKCVKKLIS